MYGDEMEDMKEMSGDNTGALEKEISEYVGMKYAVALDTEMAAVHMAVKLAAEKIYGSSTGISTPDGLGKGGALYRRRVFCHDLAFSSAVNPVLYEGGEPVFIDASPMDWGMDQDVLELAFERYSDVKIVIMTHVYGFPGQVKQIKEICRNHAVSP